LAEHWSLGRVDEFRARLATGLRGLLVVLVPAAVGYITLGRPIVRLLLGHGAMSASDVRIVADVLALMAAGLPAFSAYLLLMRAYQAMQDARQVFYLYLVENAVNVGLALALYPSMGVRGLALAFTIAYTTGTVAALWTMRRRVGGIEARALMATAGRVLAASAVMAVVTALCGRYVGASTGAGLVARVTIGVVAGVTVYVAVARALGEGELAALLRIGRGKRQPG
jgi:putative peptidoglycan lipid II flippase